jgi:hypothetical protein
MILEFIGRSMPEDFEEFLHYRMTAGIGGAPLKKWSDEDQRYVGELRIEEELVAAGLDHGAAGELESIITLAIGDAEEEAYAQGVKDGAKLQLHLLGMAPENKKEASQ